MYRPVLKRRSKAGQRNYKSLANLKHILLHTVDFCAYTISIVFHTRSIWHDLRETKIHVEAEMQQFASQ